MFDALVLELSERYGLGDRSRLLFGLLLAYIHNDHRGGFTGFIEGFRQQGHGELVASWFGNPDAGGMNASDVGMIFGQGLLNDWGGRLGVSRATVAAAIAGVLPRLVAELTPGGHAPGAHATGNHAPDRSAPDRHASDKHAADGQSEGGLTLQASSTTTTPLAAGGRPGRPRLSQADTVVRTAISSWERGQPGNLDATSAPRAPTSALQSTLPTRSAVRTPVEARQAQAATPGLDPAEQRVAEMVAALGNDVQASGIERPDNWRPTMPAPRERRRLSWLIWLVLAVLAAGGAFAWQQGLLAPYIQQYNLPIPAAPGMG